MIVDPRPFAVGSIAETFSRYPHIGPVLPAVGYSSEQLRDLEATIARVDCDAVLVGTPFDLARVVSVRQPCTRARYELEDRGSPTLRSVIEQFFEGRP
jgi:predicted GTPase